MSGGPSHPGCTRRLARTASRTVRWRSDCGSAAWSAGWCPTALVRRFRGWPDCPRGHRQQRQAPPPTIIGRWGDGQQDDQEFGVDRNRKLGFAREWERASQRLPLGVGEVVEQGASALDTFSSQRDGQPQSLLLMTCCPRQQAALLETFRSHHPGTHSIANKRMWT